MLSRFFFNSELCGGGFAPRHLNRSMLRGKFKAMRKMASRKYILAFILCLICSSAFLVIAQRDSETKLPKNLVQQLIADINDNENNFRLSDEDLKVLHKNLKFELHDLNNDGVAEYFLFIDHSDWCGAGSNCSYWVFQKTRAGYNLLVEDKVLRVKETTTNGYRDLSSETPMGFCGKNIARLFVTPYKYDGEKYKAQKEEVECRAFTPSEN